MVAVPEGNESWVGQRDSHPCRRVHNAGCCSYTMANMRSRNAECGFQNEVSIRSPRVRHVTANRARPLNSTFRTPTSAFKLALPRGFAPRASAFAGRRAGSLAPWERKAGCRTWTRTRTRGLTGRRATLTPSGRIPPAASLHAEVGGCGTRLPWAAIPRWELADPTGLAPATVPQTTGRSGD